MQQEYGLQARVSNLEYCDEGDPVEPDTVDWIVAAVFALVLVINGIGTFYDVIHTSNMKEQNDRSGNQYLLSFSVIKNWQWLFSENKTEDTRLENLQLFNGVKSICTFFVILAHVGIFLCGRYIENTRDFEETYNKMYYFVIFNGHSMVQVFFTISGFLLIINLEIYSETKKITWSAMPKIMFYRWWRLTPANALMIAFSATWLRQLGGGPLWRLDAGSAVEDCRRYWWLHLLYLNNYATDDKLCALQTWHIAVDWQLFFVGISIYIAARRKVWPLLSLLLAGTVLPLLQMWIQDFDQAYVNPENQRYVMKTSEYYHNLTVFTHNNVSSYTFGMIIGYLWYYGQKKSIPWLNHKIVTFLTWCAIPTIVWFFAVGKIFYSDDGPPSLCIKVFYEATYRLTTGLVTGLTILAIGLKSKDSFISMMMWRGWTVPSRLSYCVYLVHMGVVHVLAGNKSQVGKMFFFKLIITHLGVYIMSHALALVLFLLVEGPMNRLLKVLASNISNKESKKKIK